MIRKHPLLVIVAAIIGACVLYLWWVHPGIESVAFSSDAWKPATAEQRGTMVSDLVRKKLLDGRTESEVLAMLGKPDSGGYTTIGQSRWLSYQYDVGYRGFRKGAPFAFPWSLHLFFDPNGKVDGVTLND